MKEFEEFCKRYPRLKEEAEERAAIMEYDGNLSRETAELLAMKRLREKYKMRGVK